MTKAATPRRVVTAHGRVVTVPPIEERTVYVLEWCRECEGLAFDEVANSDDVERLNSLARLGLLDVLSVDGAPYWLPVHVGSA